MEEIVKKKAVPPLPEGVKIQYAGCGALPGMEIEEIDGISGKTVQDIAEKIRNGGCSSLFLSPDEDCEEGYPTLESSPDLIFLQIWDAEAETAWACFDPAYLDSDEEAPIEPSDGQSVFPMKCTMRDRDLAALCVEWYAHTLEPYPGMDWLKSSF